MPGQPATADPPTSEIGYPSGYFSATQDCRRSPQYPVRPAASSGRARIIAALALVVAVVAAVTGFLVLRGPDEPAYLAQTFRHVHGNTEVTAAPRAVAALGPGDADAVLSLGVQPVALTAPNGRLSSFEQSALTGRPAVLAAIDTNAVAAANPDLIIATGDIDDTTFRILAEIAPTITRPAENASQGWNWQSQLTWVGRILGQQPKADELISSIGSLQRDLRNQNPDFDGKSIEAVIVSDRGVDAVLTPSFAADYLESLGFRYNSDLTSTPVDTGSIRPIVDLTEIYQIETDWLVVIRTDSAAGQGGLRRAAQTLLHILRSDGDRRRPQRGRRLRRSGRLPRDEVPRRQRRQQAGRALAATRA